MRLDVAYTFHSQLLCWKQQSAKFNIQTSISLLSTFDIKSAFWGLMMTFQLPLEIYSTIATAHQAACYSLYVRLSALCVESNRVPNSTSKRQGPLLSCIAFLLFIWSFAIKKKLHYVIWLDLIILIGDLGSKPILIMGHQGKFLC